MPCRNSIWTPHGVPWAGPRHPQARSATRDSIPLPLMPCSLMPPPRSRRRRRNSRNKRVTLLPRTATALSLGTVARSLPRLSLPPTTTPTVWASPQPRHGLSVVVSRIHSLQLPGPSRHRAISPWANSVSLQACVRLSRRPLTSLPLISSHPSSRHTMSGTTVGHP
jgi:hypothetical protein